MAKVSAGLLPLLVVAFGVARTPVPSRVDEPVPERVSAGKELWELRYAEGPAVVRVAAPGLLVVESPGLVHLVAASDGTETARWSRDGPLEARAPGELTATTQRPSVPPGSALEAAIGRPGRTTLRQVGPFAVVRSVPPIEGLPAERIGDVGIYDAPTGAYLLSFGGETSLAASTDGVIYAGSWDGLVSAHRVADRAPALLRDAVP